MTFLEFAGGIGLALGLFTRVFAAGLAIEMLVALFMVHWANGFFILSNKNGYEYVLLLGTVLFAIALRGGGPYCRGRRDRRRSARSIPRSARRAARPRTARMDAHLPALLPSTTSAPSAMPSAAASSGWIITSGGRGSARASLASR